MNPKGTAKMARITPIRGEQINVRVTRAEAESLRAEALAAGRTLSEFIRLKLVGNSLGGSHLEVLAEVRRLEEKMLRLAEREMGENTGKSVREIAALVDQIPEKVFMRRAG
jgi:hypothetical protein